MIKSIKSTLHERLLTLADGRQVALLENQLADQAQQGKPLLIALHGWLDNSASFLPLAPHLGNFHLICVDLPGHGHSDHKTTPYVFVDWLDDLYQIVQEAGWSRFTLLGHSLGALIASAYAGVFPEQVERLIMLEGLGPLSQPDDEVPAQLRRAILNRSRTQERSANGFASIDEAVAARCKVADITPQAARLICERQLEMRAGRWHWRSDPPLAGSFTPENERRAGPGIDGGYPLSCAVDSGGSRALLRLKPNGRPVRMPSSRSSGLYWLETTIFIWKIRLIRPFVS